MKKISATIFILLSCSTFASKAYRVPCLTHAQCQTYSEFSTGCFTVKTTKNLCEVKCIEIETTSFCDFKDGHNYGYCESEAMDYKTAKLDVKNDCSNAVDLKEIEHLL